MGSDDLHKKKKKRKQREVKEARDRAKNSVLIFSEGEKTEPLYFNEIKEYIKNKTSKQIKNIEVKGFGKSTVSLLNAVEEELQKSYEYVSEKDIWIVFDRDSFEDFDKAIELIQEKGYNAIWSNECFELWYLLHFQNYTVNNGRQDYYCKLDKHFKSNFKIGYEKSCKNIFSKLGDDRRNSAILHCKNLEESLDVCKKYSEQAPSTKIHILVEELLSYI